MVLTIVITMVFGIRWWSEWWGSVVVHRNILRACAMQTGLSDHPNSGKH
jgi:hypothetical protein